jgi:7-carboxy-7-deazaguanine synthase
MTYAVQEVFESIQGEGARSGMLTAFVRFAGCNLWSGNPEKREVTGACARWCDTDFTSVVERWTVAELMARLRAVTECRRVVLTGGEPLLQVDAELVHALKHGGWYVAVETNGTVEPKPGLAELIDWWTVAPKLDHAGVPLPLAGAFMGRNVPVDTGELKFVLPGHVDSGLGWTADKMVELVHGVQPGLVYLQPQDDGSHRIGEGPGQVLTLLRRFPRWRVGVQVHKYLGLR